MVRDGERYRREVRGEAVKNFRRTADFLGCCELKAVKTIELCSQEVIADLC